MYVPSYVHYPQFVPFQLVSKFVPYTGIAAAALLCCSSSLSHHLSVKQRAVWVIQPNSMYGMELQSPFFFIEFDE
jgi:hypothetical protein